MDIDVAPLHTVIVKVASRCNLNCSYCYVYNKGDITWRNRPPIMTDNTFEHVLQRARNHVLSSSQQRLAITFHGGEPCLIGSNKFDDWCNLAHQVLDEIVEVRFKLQTNGTLLDQNWATVLAKHHVEVGLSMDGPKDIHDIFRVDHAGRGSHDSVIEGLSILKEAGVPFGLLAVIQLGADSLSIHKHFISLGCTSISYILPDFTHDTIRSTRELYGPTPCADFLIPIFDDWWFNGTMDVRINNFWHMARIIMGGPSATDALGNSPFGFIVVETDGEIEGLDCLRVCENGITKSGLNVHSADFSDIIQFSTLHSKAIFEGVELPTNCRICVERDTCGGGYLPHRYSKANGFDNPSVWCADLLKLFSHIRSRLGVDVNETYLRRQALYDLSLAASSESP